MIVALRYPRLKFTLRAMLMLVAAAGAGALLLRALRESETRNRALERMREIAGALRTMETTSGEFPRTESTPGPGRPAHSWRALLAPFIRYSETDYDFHRAWDSVENRRLARRRNDIFSWDESPAVDGASCTNVLGIVGPGAAFDAERDSLTLRPGIEDLICAIEARDSRIPWMKPADLDYRVFTQPGADVPGLGTSEEGFCVIFLDGAVWFLRADTPRERLVEFMTIQGAQSHDRAEELERFRVRW